jgi:SAM-dependent methyltransferase
MGRKLVSFWFDRIAISLRTRGVVGTLSRALRFLKLYVSPSGRHERHFDSMFGVQTSGRIGHWELGCTSPNIAYANEYRATPVREFGRILTDLDIDYDGWLFIDLGAGKGRALLLAAQFPFKAVIGVEFSSDRVQVAQQNIDACKLRDARCSDVTVICQDAAEYSIPADRVVVYLNNPFRGPVMQRVVDNIGFALSAKPRDLFVVYWNPFSAESLDRAPFLTKIRHTKECNVYKAVTV